MLPHPVLSTLHGWEPLCRTSAFEALARRPRQPVDCTIAGVECTVVAQTHNDQKKHQCCKKDAGGLSLASSFAVSLGLGIAIACTFTLAQCWHSRVLRCSNKYERVPIEIQAMIGIWLMGPAAFEISASTCALRPRRLGDIVPVQPNSRQDVAEQGTVPSPVLAKASCHQRTRRCGQATPLAGGT